jgi:hypothetical protein
LLILVELFTITIYVLVLLILVELWWTIPPISAKQRNK